MKEPYWISRQEALALYAMMISQYGGLAGIRDEHLLASALAKPKNIFVYGKPTLAKLAASYAAGTLRNRPFLDGNKRTGFILGIGFLERNGCRIFAGEADSVIQTLALATGESTEAEYAAWLERNLEPA